jgi:hypothetical protein
LLARLGLVSALPTPTEVEADLADPTEVEADPTEVEADPTEVEVDR